MPWFWSSNCFEDLVREEYESVYRYAYRLSGDPHLAADLTQEAFCRAQAHHSQLRDPTRRRSWLFSILRNTYLRNYRDSRPTRVIPFEDGHDHSAPEDDRWTDAVDLEQLHVILGELPEAFRTPIILYYFEEFTYQEIATQMGVPIGTVMSRLARAKAHMRRRLAPLVPAEVSHAL